MTRHRVSVPGSAGAARVVGDLEFQVRNLLYARLHGLPGCKREAQERLQALGIRIRVRRKGSRHA